MTATTTAGEDYRLWRLHAFEALGLSYPEAWELALSDADLHRAQDMAAAGCSPDLIFRILL